MHKSAPRLFLWSFLLVLALEQLQPAGVVWAGIYAYLVVAWARWMFWICERLLRRIPCAR